MWSIYRLASSPSNMPIPAPAVLQICYLLFRNNALSCEEVQNALPTSTATIMNKAKVQILLPTLRTVAEKTSSAAPANIFSSTSEDSTTQLLSCFDSAAAPYLNGTPAAWAIFLQATRTYFPRGPLSSFDFFPDTWGLSIVLDAPLPAQKALAHCIETGLFA